MKTIYLVDVSNMFFRAYYAVPPMNTAEGLPTNALYGFLSMSIKLLREIKPDYLAYCYDRPEPSFRRELYEEYKANRGEMPDDLVPQMPYIRELTELLGIHGLDKKGFEADDIIGTLAALGNKEKLNVVIVSGDKDFAQLINSRTILYDSMKNKKYDEQGVIEKWGINADQMIDYLSIVGDSSDNIPGVKGVGPKGAQKLLAEYKTLDGIYKNVEKITAKAMKQKMKDFKEDAYLAKELVTIVQDVDLDVKIDDFKLKPIDKEKLSTLLDKLEFGSFSRKLLGGAAPAEEKKTTKKKSSKSKKKTTKKKTKASVSTTSAGETTAWEIADIEKNIEPYSEIWVVMNERGICLGHNDEIHPINGETKKVGEALDRKLLQWRGFDLKNIWRQMDLEEPGQVMTDQMLMAYVIRAGAVDNFDKVYEQYTGKMVPDLASPADLMQVSWELQEILESKIEEVNGHSVLEAMELPLISVLYSMERTGVYVDTKQLGEQSKALTKDIAKLEKKIHKESGESFNVASPKQLGDVLFNKMGIPPLKKTKTGYSTNSDVLEKLAKEHPIAQYVMDFRELSKLKSTYVDALPTLINPDSGKIHTQLRQAITTTGRLSSTNPNLQNIPIRTERGRDVRRAFHAREGYQLLSVDYSQIELRVLAEISGDPGLRSAFADDIDIHTATAAEVFGVKLKDVSSEQRRMAKAVNFGIAYGQGAFGLAESLGISRKEGSEIIGNYFGRFKKVQQYMEDIVELAKEQGYVETLFGRRRYIDELRSSNHNLRAFGQRAAINAPIQGTASDLVKKAMLAVDEEITCSMILQVHDELLFECPTEDLEEEAALIKSIMEEIATFSVPLRVNVAWGDNWEEAHA